MTNPKTTPNEHADLADEYASYLGLDNPHSQAHLDAAQLHLAREGRYPDMSRRVGERVIILGTTLAIITLIGALFYFGGK